MSGKRIWPSRKQTSGRSGKSGRRRLSAVKQAGGLLAGGGGGEIRERVQQLRKDLEMVLRLEEIRLERAVWREGKFDNAGAVAAYVQAFRNYGIDLEKLPREESVTRLKERSHIALPLAVAIDDYAESRFAAFGASDAGWLSLPASPGAWTPIRRGIDSAGCWGSAILPNVEAN